MPHLGNRGSAATTDQQEVPAKHGAECWGKRDTISVFIWENQSGQVQPCVQPQMFLWALPPLPEPLDPLNLADPAAGPTEPPTTGAHGPTAHSLVACMRLEETAVVLPLSLVLGLPIRGHRMHRPSCAPALHALLL